MENGKCRVQNAEIAGRFSFAFMGGDFRGLEETENENHHVGRADLGAPHLSAFAKSNGKRGTDCHAENSIRRAGACSCRISAGAAKI